MKYYYQTPQYSVALNAKVGSSSLAKAIVYKFYPEKLKFFRVQDHKQYHNLCPGDHKPNKPVVLLVRDPIDRFLSACSQLKIAQEELDAAVDSLVNDSVFIKAKSQDVTEESWQKTQKFKSDLFEKMTKYFQSINLPIPRANHLRDDVHFLHQHQYAIGKTVCFQFPRDFKNAIEFLHLQDTIEHINEKTFTSPVLNDKHIDMLQKYYSIDQQLFNSIIYPGFVYQPTF